MKILPPVIEKLLEKANLALHILEAGDLGGSVTQNLRKAIVDAEQYKKQLEKDNLISLFIESKGDDGSQDIGGFPLPQEKIEIKMPRLYIAPDADLENPKWIGSHGGLSIRKEIKELFSDACSTLFETAVGKVYFEDEN